MRDESFDYENRLEHQILWPGPAQPVEICEFCGDDRRHKVLTCAYCNSEGCRYTMIYNSDYVDWFCDETCLDRQLTKDGFKKEEDSNAGV